MKRTLVLNNNYSPLGTVSWKRAVILLFEEKAELLEEYDVEIKSPSVKMNVPAVIRLFKWIKGKMVGIRFNKSNVYLRDKGRCQYCNVKLTETASTYDHVWPKSRGGKTEWTNIVTCCYTCNQRKENKTPDEAGMKLLTKPVKPTSLPLNVLFSIRFKNQIPELWKQYIGAT